MAALREKRAIKKAIAASSRWLVESMRMTMFFSQNKAVNHNLFQDLIKSQAEVIQQITAQSFRRDQGGANDYFYTLDQRPNRLDLVVGARPTSTAVLNIHEAVQIGDYNLCFNHFMSIAQQCVASTASAERLAFASALVLPVETVADSNRLALEFLPFLDFDPDTSTNLLYQINKRFQSKSVKNIELTKLVSWQSFTRANFDTNANVVSPVIETGANMLRLAMDINTDFTNARTIQAKEMRHLLTEMGEVASAIKENGD